MILTERMLLTGGSHGRTNASIIEGVNPAKVLRVNPVKIGFLRFASL
jgi:hypothetical protein